MRIVNYKNGSFTSSDAAHFSDIFEPSTGKKIGDCSTI